MLVLACSADSALATYTRTWQQIIGTSTLRQLAQLNNGDILVAGKTGSGATQNFLIYRLKSSDGSIVWSKTLDSGFGGDDIFDLIADPATGDAWFCGFYSAPGQGSDWFVQKISGADGSFVWSTPFTFNSSGTNPDTARSIAFVNESVGGPNIVVCGDDNSTGGHIAKINASTGAQMWATDLGHLARAVRTDASGNIYMAGYLNNSSASVIAKYTSNGTLLWTKTFTLISGATVSNYGGLAIDPVSGDAVLASQSSAAAGGNDISVVRFKSSDGSVVWQKTFNGAAANSNDAARGALIDGTSVYVIGIVANGGSTGGDWLVASVDLATGNTKWLNNYTGEGSATTGDQPDNLQVVGTDLFVSGFLGFSTTGKGRSSAILRLDKATGNTVEQTIFKDRVGPTTQSNTRNLIVLSNGDVITAGDSNVTTGSAEITRYGTSLPFTTSPTITSVTGPTAGTYLTGQALSFTVNYSAAVTVNTAGGTPTLPLTIGATARNATYVSGSPGTALVFSYTVQGTDLDVNGIASASPLVLNGGTMKDASANNAGLTFTPPTTSAVLVGLQRTRNAPMTIYVRPGGTSYTWTFANGNNGDGPLTPLLDFAFDNVPGFGWNLTRGHVETSLNGGVTWTAYNSTTVNFATVAGRLWRFVDTTPGDSTTLNTVGNHWHLVATPGSTTGTGGYVIPDNAPTDITSSKSTIFSTAVQNDTVATITPTDTGDTTGGYWAIDSQSVPNLFTLTFDNTTGNTATLKLGTGTLPAIGQTATITLRYYDVYQTDFSGVPIPGQGFSKVLTYTVVSEVSNDLTLGNDVPVNTYTSDDQSAPAIAQLSTGNAVVVWQSAGQGRTATGLHSIRGQLLSSTGAKVGSEFLVSNSGTGVDDITPSVAALNSGRFVVAYATTAGANSAIAFRIIEANGTVGSEVTVAGGALNHFNPAVATLTDGSFVVVWADGNSEVSLHQFNASDGSSAAAAVVIVAGGAYPAGGYFPSVAALSNGSYAVAWVTNNATGHVFTKVGGGTAVDTGIAPAGYVPPRLTGLAGGFVVASDSYDAGTTRYQIDAVRYNNSAVIQGTVFRVNTLTAGNRYAASVATLTGGGFIIGWMSDTDDYDLSGVFGRRYAANGTAVDTTEFEINQHRANDQSYPALAPLASDAFAAAWTRIPAASVKDSSNIGDIYARVLVPAAAAPTITSATYDASTGVLTVTGTGIANTDTIDPTKLTITGANNTSYTLTAGSATAGNNTFSVTLNSADQLRVDYLLNKNLTVSVDGTTYNLAGAANWDSTKSAPADLTGNPITASNVAAPTITSATYNVTTHVLTVTGTHLVASGSGSGITVSKLTIKGEGGVGTQYTLTSGNVDPTSSTTFTVTLNATDQAAVQRLFTKNGTISTGNTTYNLAAADDWNTVITGGDISDSVNAITVSNVAVPTFTSATYNTGTGVFVVTGSNFLPLAGSANDIVASQFLFVGDGNTLYRLFDTPNVEITSATSLTITLSAGDLAVINSLATKNGFSAADNTVYNLSAAQGWDAGAYIGVNVSVNTASVNVTIASSPPTVTTATQSSVTSSSATLGGNVTSDGGATVTERGVVYALTSANTNPQINGTGVTKVTGSGTTGIFTVPVSGLTANSGYTYAAYASNSVGVSYSPVSTFSTPAANTGTTTGIAGAGQPVSLAQPSLGLNWYICKSGIFPSSSATSGGPFVGEIFCLSFDPTQLTIGFGTDYLPCDGRLLPITQNQALYALLGTTYGGDGKSTFGIPDLRGRLPVGMTGVGTGAYPLGAKGGQENVNLTVANLPSHTHSFAGGTVGLTGDGVAFTNRQPYLALNIALQTGGIFDRIGMLRVFAFGGDRASGFLTCDGRVLPVSQNPALYSVMGTKFGGNGSATFGIPDLQGRTLLGTGTGPTLTLRALGATGGTTFNTLTVAQMAAHAHIVAGNPATGITGQNVPVSHVQPFQALTAGIVVIGFFGTTDGDEAPGIGEVRFFARALPGDGTFVACDGSLVQISQKIALFALCGAIFGGDGTATFALPDLRGRAAVGAGTGQSLMTRRLGDKWGFESAPLTVNQLPPHTHSITLSPAPTVTTPTSAGIAAYGATLGGNMTSGAPVTDRGVVYALTSVNANPQIGGPGVTVVSIGAGTTGVFTVPVSGLNAGSAYSFTAYAVNGGGTGYSSVGTFTTAANTAPTVASPIADFSVNEDAFNRVVDLTTVFTDAQTPAASLVYSLVANTNAGLVTATITSLTNLTMAWTANSNGTSQIAVKATDSSGLSVTNTFVVTVNPVNDAPVVSLATNAVVAFGDGVGRTNAGFASAVVGPPNEAGQTMSYTLTADNPGLFSVAPAIDSAGTLTFTPVNHTNGATRVVVVGQDSGGTANGGVDSVTNVFTVVVQTAPGTVEAGFAPLVAGIFCLAVQPDQRILLGGNIGSINGVTVSNLARLNPDGTLDASFSPTVDAVVQQVAVQPDGRILMVGGFSNVNGVARGQIARLLSDGSLDLSFSSGANSNVLAMALQADGKVLVGGPFTQLAGGGQAYLGRLLTNGALDTTFAPVLDNQVVSLAVQGDGRIVAGGDFLTVNGNVRMRLARFAASGVLDTGLVAGPDNTVTCVAAAADGTVVVGGTFALVGGLPRTNLVRFNADGTVDAGFTPAPNGGVRTVVFQADGRMLVGGTFTSVGGVARGRVVRLGAGGQVDGTFDPGANGAVIGLAQQGDGRVLATGGFTAIGGRAQLRLARLVNDPAAQALVVSGGSVVTWQRSGSAPEANWVTFDQSTNGGSSWTLLGNGVRVGGGWQLGGLTLPASGWVRAHGMVASGLRSSSAGLVEAVTQIVNTAPTAGSALAAVNLNAGTPVATVALPPAFVDAQQASASLVYTVTGNTNVAVVVATIGNGTNLVLTPVAGLSGTSLVTVRATDAGGLFLERTVLVTVTVNQAPTVNFAQAVLGVAGTVTGVQTVTGFGTLTAGGAADAGQVLTDTVTTDNPGLFSAAPVLGTNGTLTYTLSAGASAGGNAVVTVVVADNGGTALGGHDRTTNTFTISVVPANLVVTSTADSGPGSLRQVIANANAAGTPVTILFAPGAGITPLTPLPAFTGPVTLAGSGALPPLTVGAGGTLNLGGGAFSGTTINVGNGGTIKGSGTFAGTLTVAPGGTVSPGASPGALTLDAGEWAAGATYEWEINDATGVAGTASDLLTFTGQLAITATAGNPFTVKMKTLTLANAAGPMVNFDATKDQAWTIALAGMVNGFDLSTIQLDTTGVANAGGTGKFGLRLQGGAVQVTYTLNTAPTVANAPAPVLVYEDATPTVIQLATVFSDAQEPASGLTYAVTGNSTPSLVSPAVGAGGALTLTYGLHQHGSATLTVRATDADGLYAETTINVTVTPVNQPPSFVLAGNVAVAENSGAFSQGGFASQISSGPPSEASQTVSFTVANDRPALFSSAPAISPAGGLTFTPAANTYGVAQVTVTAQDNGGTANGGHDTSAPQQFTIAVLAPPTNSVPGAQTNSSNKPLYFTATNAVDNSIRVADPDSTNLTVTLNVTNGTLAVADLGTLAFTGGGTTNLQLYGTLPDLNATLQTLVYQSFPDAFGPDLLTVMTVDDTPGGGQTNAPPTSVPITVEVPALGGLPQISLGALNNGTHTVTNVVAVTSGPGALNPNLIQGITFDPANNVMNVLPVGGQDGSTNRTTISVTVQFSDGTAQLITVPVTIYQPLLAATTNAGAIYDASFGTPLFNLQTSLYEQKVRVQNNTPFDFTALRLTATNLPATVILQNATLTNGGLAYIDYNTTVPAGGNVTLKLEYFSSDLRPFTPGLKLELLGAARGVTAPPGAVMTSVGAKTGYSPDGARKNYLYFPSRAGQRYYVQYYDFVTVPQVWETSPVVLTGTGQLMNWMDDGPPATATPPGALRFYRIVTDR